MSEFVRRASLCLALLFAALLSGSAAAAALTVSPTGNYTGTSTNAVFTDTTSGLSVSCTSASLVETVAADGTGTIGSSTFSGCRSSLGLAVTVTQIASAATRRQLIILNRLTHPRDAIDFIITAPAGGKLRIVDALRLCQFDLAGRQKITRVLARLPITINTYMLDTTPESTIAGVTGSGCPATLRSGNLVSGSGSFALDRSMTISG